MTDRAKQFIDNRKADRDRKIDAIAAEADRDSEIDALQAENIRLREALALYGAPDWDGVFGVCHNPYCRCSNRPLIALEADDGE